MTRQRRGEPSRAIEIVESLTAGQPSAPHFFRGLAMGALAGAALAGSILWERRREARSRETAAEHAESALDPQP